MNPYTSDSRELTSPGEERARALPKDRFRFGVFELDIAEGTLLKSGRAVAIQNQPLEVLALLLRKPGEIVSRDDIRRHIWTDGTHIDFDQGINHCVRSIRAALGDSAGCPRFIETVPRRGYRFIGPVRACADPVDSETVEGSPAPGPPRRAPIWRGLAAGVLLLTVLLVTAAPGGRGASQPAPARAETATGTNAPVLVVLPFQQFGDESSPPYIGDAMTEELTARLGRDYAGRLTIIARTSAEIFERSDRPVSAMGPELGASHFVEGSVQASHGSVRVTAQLVRLADQVHLWAATYDRPVRDLLDIQAEVSEKIAEALALNLLPAVDGDATAARTRPEIYDLFLQARHALRSNDEGATERAEELLREIISSEPGFAPAWAELARVCVRRSHEDPEKLREARLAATRAIALDDRLASAHLILANIRFYRDYDLAGARESFENVLAVNPDHAKAHHDFAAYFSVTGRHEEAVAHAIKARSMDPLSPLVSADVGWYHYFARRYEEAIHHSNETLRIRPGYYWARRCILYSLLQLGDLPAAARQALGEMREDDPARVARARYLEQAPAGEILQEYWRWDLDRTRRAMESGRRSPADLAMIYVAMGDRDNALTLLEEAFTHRRGWQVPFLPVDPMLDALRGEPRFERLLTRLASVNGTRRPDD